MLLSKPKIFANLPLYDRAGDAGGDEDKIVLRLHIVCHVGGSSYRGHSTARHPRALARIVPVRRVVFVFNASK